MEYPDFMAQHGATLISNGYSVIPVQPGTKAPGRYTQGAWSGYPGWLRHCDRPTTDFEVDIWKTWPGAAVGVACGSVVGVDIDITEPAVAWGVKRLARLYLGDTPCMRIGQAPKRLLVYRTAAPFPSRKTKPLEILSHGTQFVAHAVHPGTGRSYEWPNDSLVETDISALPEVDAEMVAEFYAEAWKAIPAHMKRGGHDPAVVPAGYAGAEGASLHGKRGTLPAIRAALEYVPNEDLDRADWIGVGMSIKGALGDDGYPLWIEWLRSCDKSGKSGKSDTPERTWRSLKPHSRGAGSLYYRAMGNGWAPGGDVTLNGDLEGLPQVDLSAFLAKIQPAERAVAAQEAARIVTGFPPDLLDVEGALGLLMQECNRTARKPQPILALASAICCVGALAGRRYRTGTDLRTNIYAVGIGGSGSGKDNAPNVVRAAVMAAGLSDYLGGEDLASGRGIIGAVAKHPCRLFQIDEFGIFLESVVGKFARAHEVAIKTALMRLYSRAQSTYLGAEYADQKERERVDIIQPHACLYGMTTPQTFWAAMKAGAMRDGFMARLLVFATDNNHPPRQPGAIIAPSEALIESLRDIVAGVAGRRAGNLTDAATGMSFGARQSGQETPDPYVVHMRQGARAAHEAWQDKQEGLAISVEGGDMEASVARWGENAMRLALIRAVSRDPLHPEIREGDIEWGWRIGDYSMEVVRHGSKKFMAENAWESDLKRVLDVIREAGTITASELTRRTQAVPKRTRQDILDDLKEQGTILETKIPPPAGKRGKPATGYQIVPEGAE